MTQENRSALLVLDVQDWIVNRLGLAGVLGTLREAIGGARAAGIPVIYVTIGFREGSPDTSPRNKIFRKRDPQREVAPAVDARLAPRPDEIVVVKKRVSAFTGSDLELVLRSLGVDHLVLGGVSTAGVVLSTVRDASDRDYVLTVLSDCCADSDEEVHRVLMTKVFPGQADVMTTAEWRASLAKRAQ